MTTGGNAYANIIEEIFNSKYRHGDTSVPFERREIEETARRLNIDVPRNLGDLVYSIRYRMALPDSIVNTAAQDREWAILPAGRSVYEFRQVRFSEITPNSQMIRTEIPDSTPGAISLYALSDEQAVLATVRYNRLIYVFTGLTCYSLQNHLRTAVRGIGQVETDELYVGVDTKGCQYVIPVQAKGGRDELNIVQIEQDMALCESRFPDLICRPVAAQFMQDDVIALFAFEKIDGEVKVLMERHYKLVEPKELTPEDLAAYKKRP